MDERHATIWLLDPAEVTERRVLTACDKELSGSERDRQARFVFARHRHDYLVAHAMVRRVLSKYRPVRPERWRFRVNAYGKPAITGPASASSLSFNLSHTDGMIVVAVTEDRDIGVDVENTARVGETVEIADQYFSASEVQALHAIPIGEQRGRFFDLWTLKEAYIKARGLGLAIPLHQFSFHLAPDEPIRISFGPEIDDEPRSWQFHQFEPTSCHKVAVAIRRGDGPDFRIEMADPSALMS